MKGHEKKEKAAISEKKETEGSERSEELTEEGEQTGDTFKEINDKYVRLYAEFENYKKRVNKDKEELVKYGNESLLYELLPVVDSLELALKHAADTVSDGLVQGVDITLKELHKTLEKFGLKGIKADGEPFDPAVHHAMMQVERSDVDENTVVEELRKGYMLNDKVLRPSLVAVSKKPAGSREEETGEEIKINKHIEEES